MSTRKIYYVTESQFAALIEKKKVERAILKEMLEKIKEQKLTLNEGKALNEGIIDTVKSYVSKGLMTAALVATLLASGQVNAQQLQQAGVPQNQIEMAQGGAGTAEQGSQIPTEKIEARLLRAMKRAGLDNSIKRYNSLTPEQKTKILTGIQGKIKSLDDVDQYNRVSIGNWTGQQQDGQNVIQFDQKTESRITVDTTTSLVTIPFQEFFKFNSPQLSNPEQVKSFLQEQIAYFQSIDSITIQASSSTLRNTGEAEGMTWKQLSQARAEALSAQLNGLKIDLGGQGVNVTGVVSPQMMKVDVNGTNGDGTSGPKSPFEVNPQVVAAYQSRGVDAAFWQSAAKEAPLQNKAEYEKFQYANIIIHGQIVTTQTEDVPSYRYVVVGVAKAGGKIENKGGNKKADVSKCPIKFKEQKVQNAPMYK